MVIILWDDIFVIIGHSLGMRVEVVDGSVHLFGGLEGVNRFSCFSVSIVGFTFVLLLVVKYVSQIYFGKYPSTFPLLPNDLLHQLATPNSGPKCRKILKLQSLT